MKRIAFAIVLSLFLLGPTWVAAQEPSESAQSYFGLDINAGLWYDMPNAKASAPIPGGFGDIGAILFAKVGGSIAICYRPFSSFGLGIGSEIGAYAFYLDKLSLLAFETSTYSLDVPMRVLLSFAFSPQVKVEAFGGVMFTIFYGTIKMLTGGTTTMNLSYYNWHVGGRVTIGGIYVEASYVVAGDADSLSDLQIGAGFNLHLL